MNNLENMYLNQSSIDTYDTCKLKFKKIYIDNINWSDGGKNLGSDFHLLAQRYYIGLDEIVDKEKEEYILLENLKKYLKRDVNMYPEYVVKYENEDLRLLAKMDLLRKEKNKMIIYDWKTNKSNFDKMKNSYQTKIYLHNVVEKFKISPSEVKLIYYNPRHNDFLEINYDENIHKEYKKELKNKCLEIINESNFNENIGKHCSFCQFNSICNKNWVSIDSLLI